MNDYVDSDIYLDIKSTKLSFSDFKKILHPTCTYRYGELTVPPRLSLRDVWMIIKGTFNGVDQFTVDKGGELTLHSTGRSDLEPWGSFDCVNMTVRSDGHVKVSFFSGDRLSSAYSTLKLKI